MPQIWLDDGELADFAGLSAPHARIYAIQQGWARMRSHSGLTRSRLPAELTPDYLRFFTQMAPARENTPSSWTRLRKTLMALIPGGANMTHHIPSQSLGNDAKSGHSIARMVLVSENRQSEAA